MGTTIIRGEDYLHHHYGYRWLELFEIKKNDDVHLNTAMAVAATLLNLFLIHVKADLVPSLGNSFRRNSGS
jgi:hypothetical protein